MAIMKCRECGNKVSSEALTCPHCGVNSPAKATPKAAATPTPVATTKKGMSFWKKIGIGVLAIWIIGFIMQMSATRKGKVEVGAETTNTQPGVTSLTSNNKTVGDHCFNKGDAIATVYLANIKQAVDVGMLASDMMNRGCSDSAGAQGQSCVDECKSGFKTKAKQWVKDGSLN